MEINNLGGNKAIVSLATRKFYFSYNTFYRWLYAHKKVIDNAYYEVHTLGNPKQETLYYQEPLKLLK